MNLVGVDGHTPPEPPAPKSERLLRGGKRPSREQGKQYEPENVDEKRREYLHGSSSWQGTCQTRNAG